MFENIFKKYISAQNIIFFIVAILMLIFITKIKDIAILFFAAYVIACSLNPIVDKLRGKLKRGVAASVVLGSILLMIIAFFVPLFIIAGKQISLYINHIPQHIESIRHFLDNTPFINKSALANIDIGGVLSSASGVTSNIVNQWLSLSANIAQAFIYLIAGILIVYYFMADRDSIKEGILKLFPKDMKEKADNIIKTISQKIGGYVIAQIVTMSSVGVFMTLGLLISGIEYPILLGLMTAILDIVPVVGPAIALIICLITTYKAGALAMFLVVVVFSVTQLAENNLVRPYIFGKIMNLHPLIIYLFLFITAQYFGIIGVVFAPAIAATVCVLIDELYVKNIN